MRLLPRATGPGCLPSRKLIRFSVCSWPSPAEPRSACAEATSVFAWSTSSIAGNAAFHAGRTSLTRLLPRLDGLPHVLEFGIVLPQVEVGGGDLRDQRLHHGFLVLFERQQIGARSFA